MDWEPAESYGMDVDENIPAETPYFSTQLEEPYSPDVYMASTTVEEVYMSSPILTSPPLSLPLQIDRKSTFFLPPLNLNTKPIVFPPLNIHAFSLLTLKDRVGSSEVKPVPPHSSSEIYMPAALPEPPTPSNTRGMDQDPRPLSLNSDCRPTSKSGTALQGVSPILTLVMSVRNPEPLLDILEGSLQVGDIRTAALDIPIKSIGSSEGPDETLGNDITPSDGKLFLESATPPGWPDWIVDQDITPSTPHPVFAETDTPGSSNRTVDEDPAPNSQYPNLETSTAFHSPQATNSQVYIDCGVDLIGLFSPNPDSPNLSEDDPVLRAFGGSSLEDLDWIHEGFRVTNFPDTCIEPYDWAVVSETSPDLISFNSAYDLGHRSVETSLVLATTHSGSFKLSSGDAIQSQSNLFRTSTPAPCDISSLVAEPTLDNMAFDSAPEIVIDTYDSQSFLSYYPASDIPEIPDISNVLSCSPFNSIYFQASALDDISKAAYTFERNARRNVELFKKKLSIEVQKLRVRTKTSTKFLASQDIQTTTHAGPKIDVKHDVFGEIAEVTDKSSARSTKKDASTQTQKLPDAAYSTSSKCPGLRCLSFFLTIRPSPTAPVFSLCEVFSLSEVGPRFHFRFERFGRSEIYSTQISWHCDFGHLLWFSISCIYRL